MGSENRTMKSLEIKEEDNLNRLLELVSNHGHKDLSQNCEVCIEIKQLKQQILQDHEDALDLKVLGGTQSVVDAYLELEKDRQIIKSLEEFVKNDPMPSNIQFQLQKILEGKK